MAGRRRYIPLAERYAAALSLLLPEDVRADLIRRRVPAKEIEALFEVDHNITVKTREIREWWNLNLFQVATPLHRIKTANDAKVHAKADRFERLRLTGTKKTEAQKKRSRAWPKGQKIKSRGFPTKEERRAIKARMKRDG